MVVHTASTATAITIALGTWGFNLATDCFRTCREAFGRCSRNWYKEKTRHFLIFLGVERQCYERTKGINVIPRIMRELGLDTKDSRFLHDADALTKDGKQYGWIRLPTKSKLLAFCAYVEITHYINMPYHHNHIEIVAPELALELLIKYSNEFATSKLSKSQIQRLKEEFGLDPYMSRADMKCCNHEKHIARVFCLLCLLLIEIYQTSWERRLIITLSALILLLVRALGKCIWKQERKVALEVSSGDQDLEAPLLPPVEEVHRTDDPDITPLLPSLPEMQSTGTNLERGAQEQLHRFNCMKVSNHWYGLGVPADIKNNDKKPFIHFRDMPQAYAVQIEEQFALHLAEHVEFPADSTLHICIYNPTTDPYLTEVDENFISGVACENLLMVILPSMKTMDASLLNTPYARVALQDTAQFIMTEMDLESLLQKMTPGVPMFPKMVFILPTDTMTTPDFDIRSSKVWCVFNKILRPHNCHDVGRVVAVEETQNFVGAMPDPAVREVVSSPAKEECMLQ